MPYATSTEAAPVDTETPRKLGFEGLKVWWLLNRDAGATQQIEFHVAELPPGFTHGLHRHPNAAEIVYVLEGEALHLSEDAEPVRQCKGDLFYIPAGEWHGLSNATDGTLVVIGISEGINHYEDAGYEDHPSVAAAGS